MSISRLLIRADQGMDNSILFTWLNNMVDCALKLGLWARDAICRCGAKNAQPSQKDYWNYLRQKDVTMCAIGSFPILGYFGVRALKAREPQETIRARQTWVVNPQDLTARQEALLWKDSTYVLIMLEDNLANFEHVSTELLYDPKFMKDVLNNANRRTHIVYKSNLGLDKGYLAKCLTELGHDDLAKEVLNPTTGQRVVKERLLSHSATPEDEQDEPSSNLYDVDLST